MCKEKLHMLHGIVLVDYAVIILSAQTRQLCLPCTGLYRSHCDRSGVRENGVNAGPVV